MEQTICFLCFLGYSIVSIAAIGASYRNGVTDGYGYSKESSNPGYAKAGRYLRKYMTHRWPELN